MLSPLQRCKPRGASQNHHHNFFLFCLVLIFLPVREGGEAFLTTWHRIQGLKELVGTVFFWFATVGWREERLEVQRLKPPRPAIFGRGNFEHGQIHR